jgi:hypothetical protein
LGAGQGHEAHQASEWIGGHQNEKSQHSALEHVHKQSHCTQTSVLNTEAMMAFSTEEFQGCVEASGGEFHSTLMDKIKVLRKQDKSTLGTAVSNILRQLNLILDR